MEKFWSVEIGQSKRTHRQKEGNFHNTFSRTGLGRTEHDMALSFVYHKSLLVSCHRDLLACSFTSTYIYSNMIDRPHVLLLACFRQNALILNLILDKARLEIPAVPGLEI